MRATVALLLIANLVCLIGYGWISPPRGSTRPATGGDLVLVDDQASGPSRCFALQPPPAAEEEGEALAARLEKQVERVAWQPPKTNTAYWVHQPTLDSIEGARRAVRKLHEAGFNDAALATGRGWTNVVVLGIFNDRRAAVARRDAAQSSGFEVRVSERERELRPGRLVIRSAHRPQPPEGHQWVAQDCAP